MNATYWGCESLTQLPEIPYSVINASNIISNCGNVPSGTITAACTKDYSHCRSPNISFIKNYNVDGFNH